MFYVLKEKEERRVKNQNDKLRQYWPFSNGTKKKPIKLKCSSEKLLLLVENSKRWLKINRIQVRNKSGFLFLSLLELKKNTKIQKKTRCPKNHNQIDEEIKFWNTEVNTASLMWIREIGHCMNEKKVNCLYLNLIAFAYKEVFFFFYSSRHIFMRWYKLEFRICYSCVIPFWYT